MLALGPTGEGETVDLGVVADIHRQMRMQVGEPDEVGVRMRRAEFAELPHELAAQGGCRHHVARDGLDHNGRAAAVVAGGDEGGAGDSGVRVEDRLDLLGVERAVVGFDPLGLAAAEPEAALGVEVAEIAETVPDGGRPILDF